MMNRSRAFTLVETMVAIAILTIAIVAPFTAAQRSLQAAYAARDELIASSLAQEGLEYVREVRDNNYLANPSLYDQFAGLDADPDNCVAPNQCVIDPSLGFGTSNAVTQCPSDGGCSIYPLYIGTTGTLKGVYNQQQSGTATTFVRSVTLEQDAGGLASTTRATVNISWTGAGGAHSETLSEDFYAWL